ncbi:YncE family protein [Pseudaminobacter sp. NGMCC 1.201702]|uniref:YncE family protein n=1 Tax=Pseudaminobacter sp. NGMCC 1.201702 TaxID=3391825 RepID=UPI0039F04EB8
MTAFTRIFIGSPTKWQMRAGIVASIFALGMNSALAQVAFEAPDAGYEGRVRVSGATVGAPVHAGGEVTISGQNFKPGQQIVLSHGTTPIASHPFVADQEGKFTGSFSLPAEATIGMHPLVLSTAAPYHAEILDLKISPEVALSGADLFDTQTNKLVPGLYQSAYSAKNNAIYVTAASGRPPVKQSQIIKVDPATLEIVASVTPDAAPGRDGGEGGVFAVYGVAVDDANDTIWVTNTRQNTVAVYKQSNLSLVKQFEPGMVEHARDVAIDEKSGRAYASSTGSPNIAVFNIETLELVENIEIKTTKRGKDFSVGSLSLDAESGKLYTVSLATDEAAIIDIASGAVEKVFPVEGALTPIGVAHDAKTNRIFVAGQGSDNLSIVDADSGMTLHDVKVGAGALNVAFDPVGHLAYVSSRDAGTVTVVDPNGKIVANLENAPLANHVIADGKGNVYAINKSRGPDNPQGDRITRITQKK